MKLLNPVLFPVPAWLQASWKRHKGTWLRGAGWFNLLWGAFNAGMALQVWAFSHVYDTPPLHPLSGSVVFGAIGFVCGVPLVWGQRKEAEA